MKIGHAFPAYRHVIDSRAADCREECALWAQRAGHEWVRLPTQPTCTIEWNRNLIVASARLLEVDLLMMQDADAWVPPISGPVLPMLMDSMESTGAALVVPVFTARGKGRPMVFPLLHGQIFDAEVISGSMMLLDMRLLRNLPTPWFRFKFGEDGVKMLEREDLFFARLVRSAGHRVIADWTIPTCHLDEQPF